MKMTNQETDLVAKQLEELKAFRDAQIVARFDVIADRGWLGNLFAASEPWIEIRWMDDNHLQLDLMALKPSSPFPLAWKQKSESTLIVPTSETEALSEWINTEWAHAHGATNKKLRIWTV